MSGNLQLSNGPGGLSAGPFEATLGTTLGIGESHPVEIVLDPALPDGPWTARITLRSGEIERVVEGQVTFSEVEQTVALDDADEGRELLWPAVIAGVLALLALLLLFRLWKGRNRGASRDVDPAPAG
jgi:hypothetical protein